MDEQHKPFEATPVETTGEVATIALNAISVIGGLLAAIAGTIIAKRQNRRLHRFLTDLAEQLQQLRDRVNTDFVQTEDFQDLAEDIFSKAAETRQQEKLDALRAIFLNTVVADRPRYDEAAEIADLIDRWQARHVILLRTLADPITVDREMGGVVGPGGGGATSIGQILSKLYPDWDDEQIERTWQDLYEARIHRTPGTHVIMTNQGIHQLEGRLTGFGNKVVAYISDPI